MGFILAIGLSESNVSIASNTSVVTVSVTVKANDQYSSAFNYNATSVSVNCDGQSKSFGVSSYSIPQGGSAYLGSTSFTVTHSTDGSKSISASATFYSANSYVGNVGGSASLSLTTIPRASSFTISGSLKLGSPMTINIARASSSFAHTVRYQFGSIVREYYNQGTSCSFTPPYEDGSQIPNSVSGTGAITVYTFNGSTFIGSKTSSFKMSIEPTVFAPTFEEIKVTRIDNGVPSAWSADEDLYVQGFSKASAEILGAISKYGATIKEYRINIDGVSGGNGLVAGPFRAGDITITASVVDSRNISTNRDTKIKVCDNAPPSLALKAERCNSAGTATNNGRYIKITPTYSYASINDKNYLSSKVFEIEGTSYKNTTGASDSGFILGNNDIDETKAYVVSGIITDALEQSSSEIEVNITTDSVPIHVRDKADGLSFGKYSEIKNAIDSGWDIYVNGSKVLTQNDCPFSVGSVITNSKSSFDPNIIYPGTKWERIKGRVIVGVDEDDGDFNTGNKVGGSKFLQKHKHKSLIKGVQAVMGAWFQQGTNRSGLNWNMGAYSATLDVSESGTGDSGNLQPYITKYVWERTA